MPFELAHLAVGIQTQSNISDSFLAGLIYPDIRYPAQIERRLTHTMEPVQNCEDTECIRGVRFHLEKDKKWDELVIGAIQKPREDISDGLFVGILKLIHDKVVVDSLTDPVWIKTALQRFAFPTGLPVSQTDWDNWVGAIVQYIDEGPTSDGLTHIVMAMKFQTKEAFEPRLMVLEQWFERYKKQIELVHYQLTSNLKNKDA